MKQQKVLIVASIVGFIETFNKDLIEYLNNAKGCELHIACNFDYFADTDEEITKQFVKKINQKVYISTTSILHDHLSVARTMIAIKN